MNVLTEHHCKVNTEERNNIRNRVYRDIHDKKRDLLPMTLDYVDTLIQRAFDLGRDSAK